jgi:hypothetical protein
MPGRVPRCQERVQQHAKVTNKKIYAKINIRNANEG